MDSLTTLKLTVEIKEGKFIYSYEIGENKHNSSSSLTTDQFTAFTELVQHCARVTARRYDECRDSLKAKAWIEVNKEEARKLLKEVSDA